MIDWLSAREAVSRIEALDDPSRPLFGRQRAAVATLRQTAAAGGLRARALTAIKYRGTDPLLGLGGVQIEQQPDWPVDPELWAGTSSHPQPADVASFLSGTQQFGLADDEGSVWRVSGLQFEAAGIDALAPKAVSPGPPADSIEPGRWWTLHQAVAHLAFQDEDLAKDLPRRIASYEKSGKDGPLFAWVDLLKESNKRLNDDWQSIEGAREKLRSSCEQGLVKAVGIKPGATSMHPIPAADFISCELWHGRGLSLHPAVGKSTAPATWQEVRFSEAAVRSLSNPQRDEDRAAEQPREAPRKLAPEPEWQAWVAQYRREHPVLPDVNRVIWPAAKAHFGQRVTQARVRDEFGGGKPGPKAA